MGLASLHWGVEGLDDVEVERQVEETLCILKKNQASPWNVSGDLVLVLVSSFLCTAW